MMTSSAAAGNQPAICPADSASILPLEGKRKINRQSWDYVIRSGLAGGVAGCAVSMADHPASTRRSSPLTTLDTQAKTVVGPLDRVKILFQASNPQFAKYTGSWTGVLRAMRDIYTADGSRGLFRGHSATLLRIFPYAGIKFLAYEQIRAIVIKDKSQETSVRRFMAGSMSGMISVFATYPLEVIRVRLAFETKSQGRVGLRDICRTIYNEQPPPVRATADGLQLPRPAAATIAATSEVMKKVTPSSGLANFFRGFTPTLWGMLPYAGSSFLTHDAAGDLMRIPALAPYTLLPMSQRQLDQLNPNKPRPLRAWAELFTGALAGFVSQTVSYPLEVIRRRMQVGGVVGDGHRLGMFEVGRNIVKERGWRGFYVGLGIGYVKVIPMVAVSFYVYERGKAWLGI